MTTYFNDIEAALVARAASLSGSPTIAYENDGISQAASTDYLRLTFLPGDTTQATMGDDGNDLYVGIFQIDVFKRRGTGRSTWPDTIGDHFKRGTILSYNGTSVRIKSVSRIPGFDDNNFYIIPVSIEWEAYTPPRS